MSHLATRIVARWLANATFGVNAIAPLIPRDGDDPAPPAVHIYNETQHGWVARNQVPKPLGKVQFPALLVSLQNARYSGDVPDAQSTGARTVDGAVQVAIQLVMADSATEEAVSAAIYIIAAVRNSLLQLGDGAREAARTAAGMRITPAGDIGHGHLDAPVGDNVLSLGALIVPYDTFEVTALTLDSQDA